MTTVTSVGAPGGPSPAIIPAARQFGHDIADIPGYRDVGEMPVCRNPDRRPLLHDKPHIG